MHEWGWYTIVQATEQEDQIHTDHTILQRWTSMDGRKLAQFLPLPWMVCDVRWDPTIHTGVGIPLNSSMCSCVRLIHYCRTNQSRESHPYWPHNTTKMAHMWMNENWHTYCSCIGWCVMYHELQPLMQALAPLSIYLWVHGWGWYTTTQSTKQRGHIHTGHTILQGWTSMDERKLEHFHPLPWIVCDVTWAPTIHVGVGIPLNSSMCSCVRLVCHCTSNQSRGSHPYRLHTLQGCTMGWWVKTGTLLALALDGVWCTMISNHPHRCWHPSQFINGCMDEVGSPVYTQQNRRITSILPS